MSCQVLSMQTMQSIDFLFNMIVNSGNGQVDGASASGAVDYGLIPIRVKPMTLKLLLSVSLLDAQH